MIGFFGVHQTEDLRDRFYLGPSFSPGHSSGGNELSYLQQPSSRSSSSSSFEPQFAYGPAEDLAGTVSLYERHVFLCHKGPEAWATGLEKLPRDLASTILYQRANMSKKVKLTVCEGYDGDGCFNGDAIVFPDMLVYRGLTRYDVNCFVSEALVSTSGPRHLQPEPLTGCHVFVCCHPGRHSQCGESGPHVLAKLREEVAERGLQALVTVRACCHPADGGKCQGNVLVFQRRGSKSSNEPAIAVYPSHVDAGHSLAHHQCGALNPAPVHPRAQMGHQESTPQVDEEVEAGGSFECRGDWYGHVVPGDVPELLTVHVMQGRVVRRLWRGRMGMATATQVARARLCQEEAEEEVEEVLRRPLPYSYPQAPMVDGKEDFAMWEASAPANSAVATSAGTALQVADPNTLPHGASVKKEGFQPGAMCEPFSMTNQATDEEGLSPVKEKKGHFRPGQPQGSFEALTNQSLGGEKEAGCGHKLVSACEKCVTSCCCLCADARMPCALHHASFNKTRDNKAEGGPNRLCLSRSPDLALSHCSSSGSSAAVGDGQSSLIKNGSYHSLSGSNNGRRFDWSLSLEPARGQESRADFFASSFFASFPPFSGRFSAQHVGYYGKAVAAEAAASGLNSFVDEIQSDQIEDWLEEQQLQADKEEDEDKEEEVAAAAVETKTFWGQVLEWQGKAQQHSMSKNLRYTTVATIALAATAAAVITVQLCSRRSV